MKTILAAGMISVLFLTGCAEKEKTVLAPPTVEGQNTEQVQTNQTEDEADIHQESEESAQITEITVYLNGNSLELETAAYETEGKVMVPAAEVCGFFSRSISCTMEGEVLTIEDGKIGNTIILTAGSDKAMMNGKETALEAAAVLTEEGVLMVELSAFGVLLDTDYKYQETIQSVYITESGLC